MAFKIFGPYLLTATSAAIIPAVLAIRKRNVIYRVQGQWEDPSPGSSTAVTRSFLRSQVSQLVAAPQAATGRGAYRRGAAPPDWGMPGGLLRVCAPGPNVRSIKGLHDPV